MRLTLTETQEAAALTILEIRQAFERVGLPAASSFNYPLHKGKKRFKTPVCFLPRALLGRDYMRYIRWARRQKKRKIRGRYSCFDLVIAVVVFDTSFRDLKKTLRRHNTTLVKLFYKALEDF